MEYLKINKPFPLEGGEVFPEIQIAYSTFGQLNREKDNVIWICHALTANSDPLVWWPGLAGEGKIFDPNKYFIVCVNMIGSCYGSTNPQSINPSSGEPYGKDFPIITIRDIVRGHQLVKEHLGIQKIKLLIGGSMGGQQAMEWAIMEPELPEMICLLATNAIHSPWGIAFNEAQRMAIEADPSIYSMAAGAGEKGLQAARAIAMLSYRTYKTYQSTQSESSLDRIEDFRASSYQRYQGKKLQERFEVWSYISLSKTMDTHNVGRDRDSIEIALSRIKARSLVIGIRSDVLFPIEEQFYLAKHIPYARFEIIESMYGHDGFLVESDRIGKLLALFLDGQNVAESTTNYSVNGLKRTVLPGTEEF